MSFIIYLVSNSYFHPVKQVVLENLKLPKSIIIYENDSKYESNGNLGIREKGEINSADDIKLLIKALQSVKIENITSTELLNYEKMTGDNPPVYRLAFRYDAAGDEEELLENGYIDYIAITADKRAVIEEWRERDFYILLGQFYNAIYPITLSDEAVNRIFSYIK
jgi:hypothetical protein